jgi:predicted metal-binding transcription factor (methanogenesis marker protein 9)
VKDTTKINNNALENVRAANSNFIEQKVQLAVGKIIAEGKKVSFYNVAAYAQIARSTLYRNANLRKIVEDARSAPHFKQSPLLLKIKMLEEENRCLKTKLALTTKRVRKAFRIYTKRQHIAMVSPTWRTNIQILVKEFKTIDEQVAILESRGIKVDDDIPVILLRENCA